MKQSNIYIHSRKNSQEVTTSSQKKLDQRLMFKTGLYFGQNEDKEGLGECGDNEGPPIDSATTTAVSKRNIAAAAAQNTNNDFVVRRKTTASKRGVVMHHN